MGENGCWTFLVSNISAICFRHPNRNLVRYLWSNNLIRPFRDLADGHKIALFATVYVSYLSEEERNTAYKVIDAIGVKLRRHLELLNLNDEGQVQDLISFLTWVQRSNLKRFDNLHYGRSFLCLVSIYMQTPIKTPSIHMKPIEILML